VSKSRGLRPAAHVADMVTKQSTYRVLVRKPEQQKQLGKRGGRWENNDKNESYKNKKKNQYGREIE